MEGIEDEIMKQPKTFPVRYADDVIIFANDKESLEKVKETINGFLKPRGLEINGEKTVIAPIEKGLDILGYNLREYPDETRTNIKGKPNKKGVLLIKPSTQSIKNFKQKVKSALFKLRKKKAADVVKKLNPIIRG
jgi:RNA-directed DNA polymerase